MNVFPSTLTYEYANECLGRYEKPKQIDQDTLLSEARASFVKSVEMGHRAHIQFDKNLTGKSKLQLLKELAQIYPRIYCQFDDYKSFYYPDQLSFFPPPDFMVALYPRLKDDL